MNHDDGRLLQVLLSPLVTEKATRIVESNNTVTFKVLANASKIEIKAAIKLIFNVDVKSVSVVNIKGKQKRFGKTFGRRDNIRKAYVTLMPGQVIDFTGEGI